MSDGVLRVDTGELIEIGAALRVVADEFEHANGRSDDVAEAAGNGPLAEASPAQKLRLGDVPVPTGGRWVRP